MKNAMNVPGFIEEKLLGKGSYGQVFKAKRIIDGQSYAVKVIYLRELNQREIIDSVNEIRLMASLTSPYIITFYQAFYDNKRLCIVSEYSRLGDLAHLIERRKRSNRPFKENDIWRYLIQILEGLKVLHTSNVVHRDIKSANILISAPDLIKIADLGISTVLHHYPHYTQLAKTQIGTPLYIAPEIWKKRPYDSKCDMWSLGILLYELMTFTFPFLGRNDRELTQRVCSGYYIIPKGYSNDLVSVLRRLLQVNPNNRASVNDLLNLKCIKDRVHLINKSLISGYDDNLKRDTIRRMIQPSPSDGCLLSTIKITHNLKNMHFPQPMYGKRANIIKPIEQRMHLKQGAPVRKDIRQISSPELKVICDRDLWSPNKLTPQTFQKSYQLNDMHQNLNLIEDKQNQQQKQEFIKQQQLKKEQPEKQQKHDHSEKEQKLYRSEKDQKSDHSEKHKKHDRFEKQQKSDGSEKQQKHDHSEKEQKLYRIKKQQKSDSSEKEQQSDRSEKQQKSDSSENEQKLYRSEKEQKSDLSEKEQNSYNSEKERKLYRLEKQQKSDSSENEQKFDRSEKEQKLYRSEKEQNSYNSEKEQNSYNSEKEQNSYNSEKEQKLYRSEKEQKSEHVDEEHESGHIKKKHKPDRTEVQKYHPQLPQKKQIQAPPRSIYRLNNENSNDNIEKGTDEEKNSSQSDSTNSCSSSYKSDSFPEPQIAKFNENGQLRLISVNNAKIKVPVKKVRKGNPRVKKYRYHKS